MKRLLSVLSVLIILTLSFSSCSHIPGSNLIDKNRDSQGYIQFIAEFNSGLFAYTNEHASELAYYPENPKLEKVFAYGSNNLKFSADYQENKIIYTVTNPSEDRTVENKTFDDVYKIYYDSWNNYAEKVETGSVSVGKNDGGKTIELTISGLMYRVTFNPLAEQPTIVYEIIDIA